MTAPAPVSPAILAAHTGALDCLSELELACLFLDADFWRRADQYPPPGDSWDYLLILTGRGFGKTELVIAPFINEEVAAGRAKSVGLMGYDEERSDEVQIQPLIKCAPPWFKPEKYKGGIRWPNGVVGTVHSPQGKASEKARGDNFDLTWITEPVSWPATTRMAAFLNITTGTRTGRARVIADTTSKGQNEVIRFLLEQHKADPVKYPLIDGSICDNPMFGEDYLRREFRKYTGRRRAEELHGKVFAEAEGALWQDEWIQRNRVEAPPFRFSLKVVAVDPATTNNQNSDGTGIITLCRELGTDEIYLLKDQSGKHAPEVWGDLVVAEHAQGAAGAVVETNRGGIMNVSLIRARALVHGVDVRVIEADKPMPPWDPKILWVRTIHSQGSKGARAASAAALTESNLVHHAGHFPELEAQLVSFVPGETVESPNNYDAYAHGVNELSGVNENRPSRKKREQDASTSRDMNRELQNRLKQAQRGQTLTPLRARPGQREGL